MKILPVLLLAAFLAVPVSRSLAEPPKLVVALLVDQLRYDYLERFHAQFPSGGFRLLTDDGAFLTAAQYEYCPTVTGPGHATFLSGVLPAAHGIISNDWFDKRTGKPLNCVADETVQGVGAKEGEGQRSPRNFLGTTFADEMRLRFRSKVVGVSIKDRGAILPAGKQPAGAYWFDSASGNFITSTYYRPELPAWVREFNARQRPAAFIGQTWKRLLDPGQYAWPDLAVGEGLMPREKTPTFDHTVYLGATDGFETIVPTPFGNQLLTEFALAALEGEALGQGAQPDLLCISYSSLDAAGHRFGPYSQEVQDMTLRLDRELAQLFTALDQKIGLKNIVFVLTADHGVAPTPEFAAEQGLSGARLDLGPVMQDLQTQLVARFGEGKYLRNARPVDGQLYFDHEALRARQIAPEEVAKFIRDWAIESGKFHTAFTREQLLEGRAPGAIGQRVLNGFHPQRSGDVVLVFPPYVLPVNVKTGTTHGSPFAYDTHVPVLFRGAGFQRGRYAVPFGITDIVPTLSAVLRLQVPPGCSGKVCTEILAREP